MFELIEYHIPEAIRVEATKLVISSNIGDTNSRLVANNTTNNTEHSANNCDNDDDDHENVRRFCIDPQLTSLSVLHTFLVNAFNLRADFTIAYYNRELRQYCPINSDLDLDAAYLKCSRPVLKIRLTVDKHNSLIDWDIITMSDIARTNNSTVGSALANTFITHFEKLMSKAMPNNNSKGGSGDTNSRSPLNDSQFRYFLDGEGKIKCSRELRISVFRRGIEPSLRKVVWKHLLDVYPSGLTGQQRIDFIKIKCDTYYQMRAVWQSNQSTNTVDSVMSMIRKDVIRTDRCHQYYYANNDSIDSNDNVVSLLNILTTYALNHSAKYCQGMSDLASPLLYAMKNEAHAYICFCALMRRLADNFNTNGEAMSRKFANLSQLLQYYDPEFYAYLRRHDAHELLFCYRWILLELKREFAFDDALYMLEVLWSSIPPPNDASSTTTNLQLSDDGFMFIPVKNENIARFNDCAKNNATTNLNVVVVGNNNRSEEQLAVKRNLFRAQQLQHAMSSSARPRNIKFLPKILSNDSKDIDSPDDDEFTTSAAKDIFDFPHTRCYLEKQFSCESNDDYIVDESNDSQKASEKYSYSTSPVMMMSAALHQQNALHCNGDSDEYYSKWWKCPRGLTRSISCDSLKAFSDYDNEVVVGCDQTKHNNYSESNSNTFAKSSSSCSLGILSATTDSSNGFKHQVSLPSPKDLGSNDAFMLFLCVTILLQNRDQIMSESMDANDIQMYFDGLVRKNNVDTVLDSARHIFRSYLSHWHQNWH